MNQQFAKATDTIPAWVNGSLQPIEKLNVHLKGLKHKAVSVFLLSGNDVLIQQRALSKYHTPGLWANTCCTHPHWDVSSFDCAVRRLNEELGITGVFPKHRDTIEYRADVGNAMTEHEVVDLFLAQSNRDLYVQANPDEVADFEWINFYDLCADVARNPRKYTPWLRIYLGKHQNQIFSDQLGVARRP